VDCCGRGAVIHGKTRDLKSDDPTTITAADGHRRRHVLLGSIAVTRLLEMATPRLPTMIRLGNMHRFVTLCPARLVVLDQRSSEAGFAGVHKNQAQDANP
jgi:hypothetical protein